MSDNHIFKAGAARENTTPAPHTNIIMGWVSAIFYYLLFLSIILQLCGEITEL